MSYLHKKRSPLRPSRIFWSMLVISFVAIAAQALVSIWMAKATDTLTAEYTHQLVNTRLQAEINRVQISTQDYAIWDEAYFWIVVRNDEAVFANIGSGATEGDTFDFIFIVAPDGTPIYGYLAGGDGSDISVIDADATAAFISSLNETETLPDAVTANFARINGQPAVVAASRIQPADTTAVDIGNLPIMISGIFLTEAAATGFGEELLVNNLKIGPVSAQLAAETEFETLRDMDGHEVARVSWTRPSPGSGLLRRSMPILAGVSLLLLSTSIFIGMASSRQTQAFLRERSVARTDQLTGLLNRAALEEIVAEPVTQNALTSGQAALIYMDVNKFKQLNDSAGHDSGDTALKVTASRLRFAIRATDHVARLGGDEFLCLIIDTNPLEAARALADRILESTESPVRLANGWHKVRLAIGIATAKPNTSWQALLSQADVAMYRSKSMYPLAPVIYENGMTIAQSKMPTASAMGT